MTAHNIICMYVATISMYTITNQLLNQPGASLKRVIFVFSIVLKYNNYIHLYVTGCSQVTDFIPVVTHTPEGHT